MRPHLTIIDNTHRAMIADTAAQAHDCFTGAPIDYPIGVRFVEPAVRTKPARLWTTDELLWGMFFSGLASVLFTCGMAWVVGRFGL